MVKKLILAGVASGLLSAGLVVPAVAMAATSWQAYAGAGFGNGQIITMKYYPDTITVDVGDGVTWKVAGDAHTITFLSGMAAPNPLSPQAEQPAGGSSYSGSGFVNSGIVDPGGSYTLAFTKPGTFTYNCLLHPGMSAHLVVQPAGTPYPHDQHFYTSQYRVESARDISAAMPLMSDLLPPVPVKNDSGKTTYFVTAGTGNGTASVLRFSHSIQMVHAGDSVTWTNKDPMMPHTVTFAGGDGVFTDNFMPVGGTTFDGSGFTSSGILFPGQQYTLTFTKAGHYKYVCLLHDDVGMVGTVIVLP